MKKIYLVSGARPNLMKVAPLYHALKGTSWCTVGWVHTGQHYDDAMAKQLFEDLRLPKPDFDLEVGSGTHGEQTAKVLLAMESLLLKERPDLVVVVGDVNSTLAAAVAAKKLNIKVAHLEAGLRSRDRSMPEEINRVAVDSISDIHWTPSIDGDENLQQEGITGLGLRRVGNIMIDSFRMLETEIRNLAMCQRFNLDRGTYGVVTLHRPSNVDDVDDLGEIVNALNKVASIYPLVFPVHPRTETRLKSVGIDAKNALRLCPPLRYKDFMSLVVDSKFVITDSGGIQEETTYLNIPCFTLRTTTERPITVSQGTNQLVSWNNLVEKVGEPKNGTCPELWDGLTAQRVVKHLEELFLP